MQKMQEKSVILTPNKRLSKHLQKQFCKAMSSQNHSTWYSKKILPLNAWLINCWQECSDQRILLSPYQEKLILQKVITETLGESFCSLTENAIEFHNLINNWQISDILSYKNKTEDIIVFQSIYKKFCNYCKNKGLVTISEIPTIIIPYLSTYNFSEIIFAGFHEYSPQLQLLIDTIKSTGCKTHEIDPNNYKNSKQSLLGIGNLNQEITISATWAKQLINNDPKRRVGIIVPNLMELRYKIDQIFTEIFVDTKNINISAGTPLNTIPIVNLALALLSLNEPFDLKTISSILTSPYLCGSKFEKSERFSFHYQLQQLATTHLTLKNIEALAKIHNKDISLLFNALKKWRELQPNIVNKILHASDWAHVFTKILKVFGWPGENNLTNIETIAVHHFTKLLQGVITNSSPIIDKMPYKKAVQTIREFTVAHILQSGPENDDAPVQIIGTLEAIGINFDYLWIMGVDEENWPRIPKPNPFIPITIQKKLSLPHSSVERELHFCKTLIERYKRSAKEIVFSYVKQCEDRTVAPSSLLIDIPDITIQDLNLAKNQSSLEKIYCSKLLEKRTDDCAPPLAPNEIIQAPSRLVELQSLCPFRAFVEFRLKTKEFKKPNVGISKIDRGITIHSILEEFWQKTKNHKNLCTLSEEGLQKTILECTEKHLAKLNLPTPLHELEKKHLLPLLTKLFLIEKERHPFTVIATEKPVEIKLSTIPLKLRIDRIDRLNDDKILLLDYKTGKKLPSTFDWFKPRPENIQLLLYSLTTDAIEGLALMQINAEATKFKNIGLAEITASLHTNDIASHFKNGITWHELLKYWRDILTKIATEFAIGHAAVTPASPQACQQCNFDPICRIVR